MNHFVCLLGKKNPNWEIHKHQVILPVRVLGRAGVLGLPVTENYNCNESADTKVSVEERMAIRDDYKPI